MREELPSGTVTFLFTDIEGSTRLLHALGPDAYAGEARRGRTLLDEADPERLTGVDRGRHLDLSDIAAIALGKDHQTVP